MTTFSDWLSAQLNSRNMSPAELSRRMKKDSGVISRILNNERKASNETLEAIAKALGMPPEEVFRAAGILPPARDDLSDQQRLANHLVAQTDEQTLELVIAMMETAIRQQQQREAAAKRLTPAKSLK